MPRRKTPAVKPQAAFPIASSPHYPLISLRIWVGSLICCSLRTSVIATLPAASERPPYVAINHAKGPWRSTLEPEFVALIGGHKPYKLSRCADICPGRRKPPIARGGLVAPVAEGRLICRVEGRNNCDQPLLVCHVKFSDLAPADVPSPAEPSGSSAASLALA